MTRKEAIAIIRKEYLCVDRDCDIERSCSKCDLVMPNKEPILEAYKMAIEALEQETSEDYINQQAAIAKAFQFGLAFGFGKRYDEMDNVINEIKKVITPQRDGWYDASWIPVSERLPEKNIEVLVTTAWGAITIAERYRANEFFIHEGATNADIKDVIAWMPLPSPYQAESEK